jgi:ABC-2 type transport system permease protein
MSFSRIYAVFLRQWFLIKSNPTRLSGVFLWIIIDVIQWGFISKYLGTFGKTTFDFITVILGAIILWEFMSRIQQGIMTAFLEDIWTYNFINFFASPLKVKEYLGGLVLTSIVTGLCGFLAMVLLAGIAFGYNVFKIGIFILPFSLILLVFGIAMGIFVCAIIFKLGPSAEWLAWPIPLVLSVFAGVFYPISTLPVSFQFIAKMIPSPYVFESLRAILTTGSFTAQIGLNLLIGAILSIVYLLIMYRFFINIYRSNLENGSIARFGTESF